MSKIELRWTSFQTARNDGRPEPGNVSLGRFLVSSDGFLDPAVYSAGREVTVYGVLQNVLVRNIGTRPYLYPLVKAAQPSALLVDRAE